jgi:hypothetical protein
VARDCPLASWLNCYWWGNRENALTADYDRRVRRHNAEIAFGDGRWLCAYRFFSRSMAIPRPDGSSAFTARRQARKPVVERSSGKDCFDPKSAVQSDIAASQNRTVIK